MLSILAEKVSNSRKAKSNSVSIKVTYFAPCTDKNNDAYGVGGLIETITGICRRVDGIITKSITVDETIIHFDNIIRIEMGETEQ